MSHGLKHVHMAVAMGKKRDAQALHCSDDIDYRIIKRTKRPERLTTINKVWLPSPYPAPFFKARAVYNKELVCLSSADLAGRPTLLLFYTADFSPQAIHDLALFAKHRPLLKNAQVVACSTDNQYTHVAFATRCTIDLHLLSDLTTSIASSFGVLDPHTGTSMRAWVVMDAAWHVRARHILAPGEDHAIDALHALLSYL